MMYKNGGTVLPPRLLKELQKYIQGELIYIPKHSKKRAGWGHLNGTREALVQRNNEIYSEYKNGIQIDFLALKYHLSEDSIRKIIFKINKQKICV
ncbi:MAG: CD3324 family protein [Clostridia bacterium]|nr:CD3324 family protein [Clostridia bacterium]